MPNYSSLPTWPRTTCREAAAHGIQLHAITRRRYKGKLDADADEFITFAVDGAARMQMLINDLLEYSRVGTKVKAFEKVNCLNVFDHAISNLRIAIEECGAVITHDEFPTVMADTLQFTQLFQNLLGNAIKFRGKEPPAFTFPLRKRRGNGCSPSAITASALTHNTSIEYLLFSSGYTVRRNIQAPVSALRSAKNRGTARRANLGRVRTGERGNLSFYHPRDKLGIWWLFLMNSI